MEDLSPRREGGPAPDGRHGTASGSTNGGGPAGGPGLDRQATDHIGQRLRDYYTALAAEPLPSRIAALLEQLDRDDRRPE